MKHRSLKSGPLLPSLAVLGLALLAFPARAQTVTYTFTGTGTSYIYDSSTGYTSQFTDVPASGAFTIDRSLANGYGNSAGQGQYIDGAVFGVPSLPGEGLTLTVGGNTVHVDGSGYYNLLYLYDNIGYDAVRGLSYDGYNPTGPNYGTFNFYDYSQTGLSSVSPGDPAHLTVTADPRNNGFFVGTQYQNTRSSTHFTYVTGTVNEVFAGVATAPESPPRFSFWRVWLPWEGWRD